MELTVGEYLELEEKLKKALNEWVATKEPQCKRPELNTTYILGATAAKNEYKRYKELASQYVKETAKETRVRGHLGAYLGYHSETNGLPSEQLISVKDNHLILLQALIGNENAKDWVTQEVTRRDQRFKRYYYSGGIYAHKSPFYRQGVIEFISDKQSHKLIAANIYAYIETNEKDRSVIPFKCRIEWAGSRDVILIATRTDMSNDQYGRHELPMIICQFALNQVKPKQINFSQIKTLCGMRASSSRDEEDLSAGIFYLKKLDDPAEVHSYAPPPDKRIQQLFNLIRPEIRMQKSQHQGTELPDIFGINTQNLPRIPVGDFVVVCKDNRDRFCYYTVLITPEFACEAASNPNGQYPIAQLSLIGSFLVLSFGNIYDRFTLQLKLGEYVGDFLCTHPDLPRGGQALFIERNWLETLDDPDKLSTQNVPKEIQRHIEAFHS